MTGRTVLRPVLATAVLVLMAGSPLPAKDDDRPPAKNLKAPAEILRKTPDLRDLPARLKEFPVEDVLAALEQCIADEPDNIDRGMQREMIVRRLQESGDHAAALVQGEKLYEYQLARLYDAKALSRLDTTTLLLADLYIRTDQGAKGTECWDKSIAKLREQLEADPTGPASKPLATLVGIRAMNVAQAGNRGAARQMLQEEAKAMLAIAHAHPKATTPVVAWVDLMERRGHLAAADGKEDMDDLFRERDEFLQGAMRESSDGVDLLARFLAGRRQEILRLHRTRPREAMALLDSAIPIADRTIAASVLEKKGLQYNAAGILGSLRDLEPMVKQALDSKIVIGEPAPAWEVAGWVHGDPLPRESLQGRPAILYFWSLERPHLAPPLVQLNSWHDEFHAQGLEIIGVTGQWNYSWDAQKRRPVLSEEDLPLEVEREAISQFLKQFKVRFPTLITPKGTGMRKAYGVSEMPHVVLIDRQGIVRASSAGPFNEAGLARFREAMKKAVEAPVPAAP